MSIHNFSNKIKGWAGERRQTLIFTLILVGVAAGSFYLGYVARAETQVSDPVLIQCPANAYINPLATDTTLSKTKTPQQSLLQSGVYVASKNGTKYYPVDCSAVNRIKEENKIFFSDEASAQAAGYGVGAGCK